MAPKSPTLWHRCLPRYGLDQKNSHWPQFFGQCSMTSLWGKLARSYLLVFDLGGGTFDVSVMEALVKEL